MITDLMEMTDLHTSDHESSNIYLGIPIQDPEQSEFTEHGESGTRLEEPEQGKGPVSSSETELGTLSDPGASSDPRLGSNSGIYLK